MIIGDSSALVALAVMDALDILEKLFDEVLVPQAVYDEVVVPHKSQSHKLKNFLDNKVVSVTLDIRKMGLGDGELEAIALYQRMEADFLLIDDKRAKKFANLNGVNTIGSLGVMILAKEQGHISLLRPCLEKLTDSNLYLSQELVEKVLSITGE